MCLPDLERRNRSETPANDDSNVGGNEKQAQQRDLSRALFVAVTRENLTTFKQGLAKQTKYWSGIGRIGINLEQRLAGVDDVDLLDVTDKLHTFVTLPGAELADLPHERPRSTLSGADRRLPTMDETIASSSVNRVLVEDGNNCKYCSMWFSKLIDLHEVDATSAYSSLRPFSSLWADPNLQALSQDTGQMYQILRDLGVEM